MRLRCVLSLLTLTLLLGLAAQPAAAGDAKNDPRYFEQTGYRIDDDRFWDYFNKRGGVRTFGYPISGTFTLLGQQVQIFQRQVMQLQPDGSVANLNLLDDDLMPYTRINGSTFPPIDPSLVNAAPQVGEKDYYAKALQFVKDNAPDVWQGRRVNFYATFMTTVRYEDAFPDGKGDPNLLPGLNLEIWGLPTSRPMFDPTNGGFIYQRFQRGIMHYDAACDCTQGLLLGQYFLSILTLRDLPPDLAAQARGSRFYGLLNPAARDRGKDASGTDASGAVRRQPLVVIDPGHGGKEIGASHTFDDGVVLQEKQLNLDVALRLQKQLDGSGISTLLTRTTDRAVNDPPKDLTGDDKITLADELQARVDLANSAGADLLLSIHFNGVAKPEIRGTQVFYSDGRPQTERSKAFAEIVDAKLVAALAEVGYQTIDRKATPDSRILGQDSHFYLLGPASKIIKRPSNMPAVIAEALYLTNDDDARVLRQERVLDALARAYADAIKEYFARYPVN